MQRAFYDLTIEITIDKRRPGMGANIVCCIEVLSAAKNGNFPVIYNYRNAVTILNIITTGYNVPLSDHLIVYLIIKLITPDCFIIQISNVV